MGRGDSQEQVDTNCQWVLAGSQAVELVGGAGSVMPSLPRVALQTETLLLQAERRALCACWPAGR